ncbi:hypothetical protein UQW22_15220 [Isoptericola halotolerans]|uniref:hypothetical protein n=1 Tax=Isoptericola halotolerans TaxID=300560 RepID=UPI00388FFE0E
MTHELPGHDAGPEQGHQGLEPWSDDPGASAPDVPPRPLRLAVVLMWVGAALSVVGAFAGYLMLDTVNALVAQELSAQGMWEVATPELMELMEGVVVAGLVVGGVVSAGLWSWMAVKNGQGRSWARVVGTVLAGLYVLNFLSGLAQAGVAGTAVLGVLQLALVVTTVVLMWQPTSSDHYAAPSVSHR